MSPSLPKKSEIKSLYNTIYTFTPAVLPNHLYVNTQKGNQDAMINSPVMAAEDIFRLAGWSTPSFQTQSQFSPPIPFNGTISNLYNNTSKSPFSSIHTDNNKQLDISDENRLRLMRSKDDLRSDFDRKLSKLISEKQSIINQETHDIKAQTDKDNENEDDSNDLSVIPQSYEEIYKISLRNRQKNKDKKRFRDGEAGAEDNNNEVTSSKEIPITTNTLNNKTDKNPYDSDAFDHNSYFLYADNKIKDNTDIDVESTLAFSKSIGWVKDNNQYNQIKETHMLELSHQQMNSEHDLSNTGIADNNHNNFRKSGDKLKNNQYPNKGNYNINKRTNYYDDNSDNGMRRNNQNAPLGKNFDYNKVIQQNAMNAMAGSNMGRTDNNFNRYNNNNNNNYNNLNSPGNKKNSMKSKQPEPFLNPYTNNYKPK